jgi:hypothetical protein
MAALDWVDANKDWLFPGGGVAITAAALRLLSRLRSRPEPATEELSCNFCYKSQAEVKRLIAGPGVYVCDECIDLCDEIIDEEGADTRARAVLAVCELTVQLHQASLESDAREDLLDELDKQATTARPGRRPRTGDRVCGAQLQRIVGAGTFGTVWAATTGSETVAVKVFDPDKISIGIMLWRFQRGIRAMHHLAEMGRLTPDSICRIREISPDRLMFSMDYMPLGDLTKLPNLGWSPKKKQEAFLAVCEALRFSHHHGIVHRDVKPANVVLSRSGNAVLTDFDIADLTFASTLSVASASLGSPHFAAPEQLVDSRVASDPTADIFSLGKLLYFLISENSPPLGSRNPADISANAIADADVRRVIATCTRHDAKRRYQSIAELLAELPPAEAWRSGR